MDSFLPFPFLSVPLQHAALNLFVALTCGAVIGSERQIRQRMAGLRTNALVALGAASFVIFSGLFPDEVSPTRVSAQIVSGIGFLGAGIIFRDGFTVYGINTAATLWCSAGVGMMAGAGAWPHAALLTGFVVFINLGLRPLVKWIKRHTLAGRPALRHFQVTIACDPTREAEARAFLLRTFALGGLHLTEIAARPSAEGGTLDITAAVTGEGATPVAIDQTLARLAAEPGLARVSWESLEDG
ncbi:Mg(2+) transport ATPase protein C [Rubellimicrobium mesophilum DSM 19309]|uniref:Protein MgtC n=1 Tax=Rubellimicrobium mesophilum DSM 19309 TaxID=442562 RepID=A0A017HQF0_9RHOB|nr:MgtC/SapB family protein [Rubellimicrobium mesophilum]EYD76732.1 Mg(2+) transport ATPase protein C [Rubellimicrobium mesophilum DSM 19309]